MRAFALLLLLLSSAQRPATQAATPGVAAAPAPVNPAAPFEAWRFNPRERTSRGLAAWEKQAPAAAVPPLDSALRLRPGDPLAGFNAGTAHLGAGMADAEPILERAAREAPPELAADGFYNLGNARLAQQNAAAAVEAFKESLRREPGHAGAKRNLELALRLLQQQKEQQKQQSGDSGEPSDQPQSGSQPDEPPAEGEPKPNDSGEPQPSDDAAQEGSEPQPSSAAGGSQRSPLPQFQDQKDMSAEQAAAILQAVDNLERERRREDSKQRARLKAVVEKDW